MRLGRVVLEAQGAIIEKAPECLPLADRVAERAGDRTAYAFEHALGPGEEVVKHRF